MTSTTTATKAQCFRRLLATLFLTTVAAVLTGCATTDPTHSADRIGASLSEYHQIISSFKKVVDTSVDSLGLLDAKANPDPHKAFDSFAKAVHRLEVDSVKVRARGQAIRGRGEAYFEEWQKQLSALKDQAARNLAEEHRADFKKSFDQIRKTSQETGDALRIFLSSMRNLEATLESNLTPVGVRSATGLIQSTKEKGQTVQQGIRDILAELNSVATTLATPQSAGQH